MSSNIYLTQVRSIANKNKYYTWYYNIISVALSRANTRKLAKKLVGYVEEHHILPRAFKLGGEKDKENFVYLTPREHFMAHWILCKMMKDTAYYWNCTAAFHCMNVKEAWVPGKRYTSRHYDLIMRTLKSNLKYPNRFSHSLPPHLIGIITAKEWNEILIEKSYILKQQDPEIAQQFSLSATAVWNWRKKLKIESKREWIRNKDKLESLLTVASFDAYVVANFVGCSDTAVRQAANRLKIPWTKQQTGNKFYKLCFTDGTQEKYFVSGQEPEIFTRGRYHSAWNKGISKYT